MGMAHFSTAILSQAFEQARLGTKWLPCDYTVGDEEYYVGSSKLVTRVNYKSPLYSPKRGIMQTEKGIIEEWLIVLWNNGE